MAPFNHLDSQESSSSSLMQTPIDPVNISFEDISYDVRRGYFTRERKTILDQVSGEFNAGDLSVIVGQSGAGKSSLMDILAGYTQPSSGRLLMNNQVRNEKMFRQRSCYILQDNNVHDMLTTEESLRIAAELKLGNISSEQRHNRVEEIIKALGVNKVRNTKAGNLSGGEKKRLAIGLELVSNPPVIFLDEPTSGLDCSISHNVMNFLQRLARQGRTVVISIHQPSALLLQMVDRIYAVSAGKCAYIGSVPQLLPYLQLHFTYEQYHNTVDVLLDVCTETCGLNMLVEESLNGKSKNWIEEDIQKETDVLELNKTISGGMCLMTMGQPELESNQTRNILLALKSTYPTPPWKQFIVLTRRALLLIWRQWDFIVMLTSIHLAMALFVGTLFFDIGRDAKHTRDTYSFLFFSLMFLMFTAFSAVTITIPEQIPVTRREHFNRWYGAGAHHASTFVSALPGQTLCTLIFASITYFMTGQPPEILRILIYFSTLLLVSYVALCVGLLNGSLFNVQNGVIFGPFFVMPFTIFSGFFLKYNDAPFYIRWTFQLSFLKHGLDAICVSIFGLDRPKLKCSSTYCHDSPPSYFLKNNVMEGISVLGAYMYLLIIGFVFIVLAYIVLKIRLKKKW